MAEEGSEGSVANSSSTTNLWDLHRHHHHHHHPHPHGSGLSSWNNVISWHPPPNPTSNSSCEEDISISNSFTNTSNHSGLSDDSSRHLMEPGRLGEQDEFVREPTSDSHHLWSQVLLGAGSNGDLNNHQDVGENFLEALSSKNLPSEIFEPACDYLKKTDNGWEFANTPSFNNIERQLNSLNGSFLEPEKLTNLVSNWSIAPPYPDLNRHMIQPSTRNTSLNSLDAKYSNPDLGEMKQHLFGSSSYGVMGNGNSGFMPSYGHGMKNIEPSRDASLNRPIRSNNIRYQMGHNNSFMEDNNKYYYGISDAPWTNSRNLSDIIPSNGCLNKPLMDLRASRKPCLKTSSSPEIKKQSHDHVSPPYTRGNSRANGVATEGKKKRSEDNSDAQFKKPKHETSTASSVKVQGPKVKLGERITALQQIVSPFGKTDTASVLQEAIGYIKFLQEQVQLLSNPYMKSNANKDPWGMLERKDKADAKLDLKSRGLCLVPISCTPQVYRENTGSDYWTPTYRGCLYR